MIGSTISHYKILEKLGEGGMGVVYKAHDTKLDRVVALKFLPHYLTTDQTEKERFYHEARAASALMHANIAVIFEISEHDGRLFLAMEYVEGKTLKKAIEGDALPHRTLLDISVQICDGLAAAHEKGIVHRDIKSDNIMITPKGQAKIMDFGLAKVKGATKLTRAGSTIGTAAYMSPEQARGEEVDNRSDIFSLGIVLYEMFASKLPWRAEHQAALVYSLMNEEPQPLARFNDKVTPELERIVGKALAKDAEDRYQHVDEMLADIRRERKHLEYARAGYATQSTQTMHATGIMQNAGATTTGAMPAAPSAPSPAKKSPMKYMVTGGAVFIAVILLLIFNPFNFEFSTQKSTASDGEKSIAVLYFENVSDPGDADRTARMISSLLVTSLSESKSLKVMSTQRLYDILKQLGKEDLKSIDRGTASEVAKKAGVNYSVTGEVLQTSPRIVMTVEISDVQSGEILAAERITGAPGADVFAVVDDAGAKIREKFIPATGAPDVRGKTVADVTTHSPEAYRHYLNGIDYTLKSYQIEAQGEFRKAIEEDSTFAGAYMYLALSSPRPEARISALRNAIRYSDRATERDRAMIGAIESMFLGGDIGEGLRRMRDYVAAYPDDKEAHFYLGMMSWRAGHDLDAGIAEIKLALELDPSFKEGYNSLAYMYDEKGDFGKSIESINRYISLASGEANPFDSRGDLYAKHGKLREAIESYERAVKIKPDFYPTIHKLVKMYMFDGRFSDAERSFGILLASGDPGTLHIARLNRMNLDWFRGRLRKALRTSEEYIRSLPANSPQSILADAYGKKGAILDDMGDYPNALKAIEQNIRYQRLADPTNITGNRGWYSSVVAKNGDIDRARQLLKELREDIDRKHSTDTGGYCYAAGRIELAAGNREAAVAAFRKGVNPSWFGSASMLGRTLLEQGKPAEALRAFAMVDTMYFESSLTYRRAALQYYMGMAYEANGDKPEAVRRYEKFLKYVDGGDRDLPEIVDAEKRLSKLKTGT